MGDFKRLLAWQEATRLWRDVQRLFTVRACVPCPGLRGQIIRAAGSIRSTLAEGSGYNSRADLKRFAGMAYTSAKEMEDQLMQGREGGVLREDVYRQLEAQRDLVARLCYGLMNMRD